MDILFLVIIFVLGLCCGSFVNMLVYRTAVNYGLIKSNGIKRNKNDFFIKMLGGRSFCDSCGKQLYWYENIPVISWLIQKGKTRCCHRKLPILYPIVETVTGLLFLLNFRFLAFNQFVGAIDFINFHFLTQLILSFIIIIFLVFSAVFDMKYMILPDFSTLILVICSIFFLLVGTQSASFWIGRILSALLSSGFLYLLHLITKKKGMGFGDVKLAFFMGLFLGYSKTILSMYVAFIVGALFGLVIIYGKKATGKTKISFGPFLILGTFVAWIWGSKIILGLSLPLL